MIDQNNDIVPTLRMFDGLIMGQAADEIERLRALLASYGNAAQPAASAEPVRYEVIMGLTPAHRRWEAVSLRDYESVRKSRPNEARALYTAPVAAQRSVPTDAERAVIVEETLLGVIGRLNSNPYSLTKSECVSEVKTMLKGQK